MENERLLKLKQVQEYIPFCRSKIYQLLAKKEFPKPIRIGKTTVWKESQIQEYIKKLKITKE